MRYYYYYIIVVSCHRPFLPGTSLEPAVIPTAQASSFTLQYFPYYVWCSKYSCLLYWIYRVFSWYSFQSSHSPYHNHTFPPIALYNGTKSVKLQNHYKTTTYFYWTIYRTIFNYISCDTLLLRPKYNVKYAGYSESKYCLRISLAHPRDCPFAHVQWLPLSIEKPHTPFCENRVIFVCSCALNMFKTIEGAADCEIGP
jgi:hypothetical protein